MATIEYKKDDMMKVEAIKNKFKEKAKDYYDNLSSQRTLFLQYISDNFGLIVGSITITTLIVIYFGFIYDRINLFLKRMEVYKNTPMSLSMKDPLIGEYRLADFYVTSAYKCYLPCTNWFDYASLESIKQCILYGARYLHMDIFPSSFDANATPVVCNGEEMGNWHFTNSLDFDDVCLTIKEQAFSNNIKVSEDPLFVHLSFKCWGNTPVLDKTADILIKHFRGYLLSSRYSFNGENSNTNIALTPVSELFRKMIIICDANDNNDIINSKMHELSNLNPNMRGNCRLLTNDDVKNIQDPDELTSYNKKQITIVHPNFKSRTKQNYNFYTPYYLGCQFLAMNYTEPDQFMINYTNKRFNENSIVLKLPKLRYKPILIREPKPQNPNVSFAPNTVTTAYYTFNT
jgi:plasmid maintenance system killer protein